MTRPLIGEINNRGGEGGREEGRKLSQFEHTLIYDLLKKLDLHLKKKASE